MAAAALDFRSLAMGLDILDILVYGGELTISEVAEMQDTSYSTAKRYMRFLEERFGLVSERRPTRTCGPGVKVYRWPLPAKRFAE